MNVPSFQAHSSYINRIKQSPFNNQYVATCSYEGTVIIWNPNTNWTLIRNYTGHSSSYVDGLEWINEQTIASGGADQTIQIWSISTGITNRTINVGDAVSSLKMLSNGFSLACGTGSGSINIYNIRTGSLISTLTGHTIYVNDLIIINDSTMASSSRDQTVRIWDLITNTQKLILNNHTNEVVGLKLLSFDILGSASLDSTIKVWNTTSGELIRTLANHTGWIQWSLDLLSDGQTLVSGGYNDQTIKLWNWKTGEYLNTINTGLGIRSLATIKSKIVSTLSLFFFIHKDVI